MILIVAVAAVSIVAVVVPTGEDGDEQQRPARERPAPERTVTTTTATTEPRDLPDDPEQVLGNEELALQRPRNLKAALAVLEREAQKFEGRFDHLRIAPGRIDTTMQRSDKRKHVQIRADLKIPFSNEYDFPTGDDVLARGLRAREVDALMPRRILSAVDLIRPGRSAARDLDYMVVSKSIIDERIQWSAYLQSGPRPRQFGVEGDGREIRLRVIG